MKRALLFALFVLSAPGCGDDGGNDAGPGGRDLSASVGDGGVDLANPNLDATCRYTAFGGFSGVPTAERRFDCPCGCTIDSFEENLVQGVWNGTVQSTMFNPTSTGLEVTPEPPDGGTAFAGLASVVPGNPFFLDGDFDLLVDYQLLTAVPPGAHATLQVNDLKQPAVGVYTVERIRADSGEEQYSAALAGILPVNKTTTATGGTLELVRTGQVVRALADGQELSRYTGGVLTRLAIVLGVGVDACAGAGCSFTVKWHNLRLTYGSLVDRQ